MEVEMDFEKTCRTCAEYFEDELHPIFLANNLSITKMLKEGFKGFNFKITKVDNLPKKLCDNCLKQLTQIYMFLLQCEKSEKILTEKLQRKKDISIIAKDIQYKTEDIDVDNESDSFEDMDEAVYLQPITPNEENSNCEENICKVYTTSSEENSKECKDENKYQKTFRVLRKRKKTCVKDINKTETNSVESNSENIQLKRHNSLPKKEYKCSSCFLKFDKFSYLREHKKEKHPTESVTYLCDVCGKEFNKRDRLQQHKNRHLGVKPFKCDICGKTFTIKTSLKSHMQRHVNPESFCCNVCGKNFLIKKCYEEHLKRHENEEKLFKCPYCPRTFKLLSTLTHHCTFHNKTLDKKYHCSECNTNFRRSDHLKEHINSVHLKILPFKCDQCTQAFVTGAKRNIHVKRMHSGKRYQCNQCEKDFSLPCSLNRHKKSHSGVKSLICEICNESFVTPIQIERHMETHQLDEVAKNKLITQTYEKIKQIAINQDEIKEGKPFKTP